MITKALYDYLTDTAPITGEPATDFRAPQTLAGLTINNREEARRYLRSRVGDKEIYASRRPRDGSQHTAISIRRISTNRTDEVTGGSTIADSVVQVDVWTKGPDAVLRGNVCGNLIRICCEGFGSSTWGDVDIADCVVVRESEFSEEPEQGDEWIFRYSLDLMVFYGQASAVV